MKKETVLETSKKIWKAMHEEDIDTLNKLVHESAKYVHMGVTLNHKDEMDVIKNRKIVYKHIDVENVEITQVESMFVVLTKLKLTAVVDGHEVVNPFVVTETYVECDDEVKMASMSYTRITY